MTKAKKPPRMSGEEYIKTVVMAYEGDECFIWPRTKGYKGYARVYLETGKCVSASRYVCALEHGPQPTPEHETAHNCGKGHLACVNKKHLRWATRKENNADKFSHGTLHYGERCKTAKLNEEAVREIRRLRPTHSLPQIAKMYGVTHVTILRVMTGVLWGRVE